MKFKKKKKGFVFVFKDKEEAEIIVKILETDLKIMKKNTKKDVSYFTNLISDYKKQVEASKGKIVFKVKKKDINRFMEFVIITNGIKTVKGDIEERQKEVIKIQDNTINQQQK